MYEYKKGILLSFKEALHINLKVILF